MKTRKPSEVVETELKSLKPVPFYRTRASSISDGSENAHHWYQGVFGNSNNFFASEDDAPFQAPVSGNNAQVQESVPTEETAAPQIRSNCVIL